MEKPPAPRDTGKQKVRSAEVGTDILKAMSLGASAVLVGRPAIWGLANAGAAGVAHVLRLLRDELEIAMALTGCATLVDTSQVLLNADLPQGGDL